MHYTYILKCADDTLYTGYTNDLQKRLKVHNSGKGARYTKTRLPVELIYHEAYAVKEYAMRREWKIKHEMSREQKLKMIAAYDGLKLQIDAAKGYIEELFAGSSDGHDAAHSIRVFENAMRIARLTGPCDLQLVALSALLHDADDHKLFKTKDNSNARKFLKTLDLGLKTEEILEIINSVSYSKNKGKEPQSLESAVVRDADRLDAMGAIGIARTFAYGGRKGRSLEESLAHFDEKLLHLKDAMNTEVGKEMALERHSVLLKFLEEYRFENEYEE